MDLYTETLRNYITWENLKNLPRLSLEQICLYEGNYKIVLLIYYGYNNYFKQNYNNVKLNNIIYLFSAYFGKIKIMKYLDSRGPYIYYDREFNAYVFACMGGNLKAIKFLERHGCNIYKKNYSNGNPYTSAIIYGKYQLLQHLESKETHLYLHRKIKSFYKYYTLSVKKFCCYKFNIGFASCCYLFILFI